MQTQEKLQQLFRIVFEDDKLQINDAMTANDVEKWTSLTHLVMIDRVEEEFNIKLSLKEIMKLKNVGDLLNLINLKVNT
ncbi:MAG: acyl carrier protein [Bacteroidia bacterium]|jgi:acyl carrier protein